MSLSYFDHHLLASIQHNNLRWLIFVFFLQKRRKTTKTDKKGISKTACLVCVIFWGVFAKQKWQVHLCPQITTIHKPFVHKKNTNFYWWLPLTNRLLLVCTISESNSTQINYINTPRLSLLSCGHDDIRWWYI